MGFLTSKDSKENAKVFVDVVDSESLSSVESSHIFQDPTVAQRYRELYEKTQYECRHHFDPDFTWTEEEEAKVVRRNDWNVTFWAFLMFTALNFDRTNLHQALTDNFLQDLNLTTNNYNTGNTINLVCFLAAELPSQLISKKVGPDIWIPTQIVLWSVVSIVQANITDKYGFYVTRALVGALQGGFICDVCLWISYFYTSKEFTFRLSVFYISNPLSQILSSLLAFALLKIHTAALPEGWRWMFIVEGVFTLIVGIASYFKMPASAVQTKKWYRKNGWFTEREEKIVVNRVLRDDPTKGDMHNRQPVTPKELVKAFFDFDLVPIYIVRLLCDLAMGPVSLYLQISLRQLGFSTFKTNALTIPSGIIAIITMFIIAYISERFNSRGYVMVIIPLWAISTLIPLRYWSGALKDPWGTFALMTVMLGHPPSWALSISWCSANSNSVRSRAVSAAVVNMFSQAASIISSNVFRKDDAPLYHRGTSQLIGISFGAVFACLGASLYYQLRNKQKTKKWNLFTEEEKEEYLKSTTDEGNKRLDFKFVH